MFTSILNGQESGETAENLQAVRLWDPSAGLLTAARGAEVTGEWGAAAQLEVVSVTQLEDCTADDMLAAERLWEPAELVELLELAEHCDSSTQNHPAGQNAELVEQLEQSEHSDDSAQEYPAEPDDALLATAPAATNTQVLSLPAYLIPVH